MFNNRSSQEYQADETRRRRSGKRGECLSFTWHFSHLLGISVVLFWCRCKWLELRRRRSFAELVPFYLYGARYCLWRRHVSMGSHEAWSSPYLQHVAKLSDSVLPLVMIVSSMSSSHVCSCLWGTISLVSMKYNIGCNFSRSNQISLSLGSAEKGNANNPSKLPKFCLPVKLPVAPLKADQVNWLTTLRARNTTCTKIARKSWKITCRWWW